MPSVIPNSHIVKRILHLDVPIDIYLKVKHSNAFFPMFIHKNFIFSCYVLMVYLCLYYSLKSVLVWVQFYWWAFEHQGDSLKHVEVITGWCAYIKGKGSMIE